MRKRTRKIIAKDLGSVGAAIQSDASTTDVFGIGASITGDLEFDTGFVFNGAVGYSLGGIRFEGAISYQKNDLDT